MIASRLDGPSLRKGLSRMKPSALGLDGWSLADLRSLPDRLLGWLADLLREVERLGKWLARLAEGYTALIPKEGPPGPLNTRPFTVLSMVYRLWAGVRLVDAMAWQESWAHPTAFGFRPARSALDGAAVTHVLLELCRLRGWAVAGMGIDYVKCFDLIPQAVVLALAFELGMDPGTCCALGAMYKQLRRAFKIAGALGLWLQATNSILQGCPLSVILVNVLTTMWDGRWTPCADRCAPGRPPSLQSWTRMRQTTWGREPCSPSRMLAPATLRWGHRATRMTPRQWPWARPPSRRRSPRRRSGCGSQGRTSVWTSLAPGSRGNKAPRRCCSGGAPIPLATTFRQLGVDIAIGGSKTTGPVLSRRLEAGRSALRRLPHLSTYDRRERAISTLVTPLALHGVAVAPVTEPDLRGAETAVVRALWGPARVFRAKEVIFTVLSKGHRISPVMHTRYERLLWLARLARRPGVTQVFAQAICESGGRPPGMGPVGRALRTAASLGWTPREGWWCWVIPGQEHPLHFVQEPLCQLQHRVRDSLCCYSSRQLEARRPVTFGGLGDGADGPACQAALRAASTELEKSLLRGLLAGAMWTAARVSGHGMWTNSACPQCGAAHEDEAHVLWECPEWDDARGTWLPWLKTRRGPSPTWDRRTSGCPARLFPPPAGAGGGLGPPRQVPVPAVRHVLGGPRCPHGSQPRGPAGPRGLPLSGAAAPAALQTLPLGRLRSPLAGGHRPPPTAAPAGGTA